MLRYNANIEYDPIIPLSDFRAQVEDAINTFLKNLPPDGILRLVELEDAIQAVQGFIDIQRGNVEATVAYTITPNYQPVAVNYNTVAGYIKIDPDFPLSSTLTYST